MDNKTVIIVFNTLIYGFCFTTLISYWLSLFKSEKLTHFNNSIFGYAIKTIRIIAKAYFIYYLFYLATYFLSNENTIFSNRAIGLYWLAYWLMLLRPFVFCALLQLYWFKKLKKKSVINFILVILIFFIVSCSGSNLERFVIFATSYHRDYTPNNFQLFNFNLSWLQIIILGVFERTVLFFGLVFVIRLIHRKLTSNKL